VLTFAVNNAADNNHLIHCIGGVWFGDDGTLKETVLRGEVDSLFLEAEKMGIDIRRDGDAHDHNRMTFGFFGPTTNSTPLATTVDGADVSVPDPEPHEFKEEVLPPIPGLAEVVATARLFKRERFCWKCIATIFIGASD
jgi:hypothetical protein